LKREEKYNMKIPNWVNLLLEQVAKEYPRMILPNIIWRHYHNKYIPSKVVGQYSRVKNLSEQSSGHCNYSKGITITAGRLRKDQKLVLLHELAHWILPAGENHSKDFWDLAFEIYRKFKVPMYYALNREKDYRKEAVMAYRRNRKTIPH
jgi:predicted metal-dependent hydrolase